MNGWLGWEWVGERRREGGREGGKEGRREGGKEGRREGRRDRGRDSGHQIYLDRRSPVGEWGGWGWEWVGERRRNEGMKGRWDGGIEGKRDVGQVFMSVDILVGGHLLGTGCGERKEGWGWGFRSVIGMGFPCRGMVVVGEGVGVGVENE